MLPISTTRFLIHPQASAQMISSPRQDGSKRKLHDLHVWGCLLYVLDKTISDGKKLPHWKPKDSQGIFMGLSPDHASTVPLVLNLDTGAITLMIGSLQLPPVLMTSQTSIPLHGPRCFETVSTNSSGMNMTPRLSQKTSWPLKPSPPGKIEFPRLWTPPCLLHPCQYLLLHLHLPLLPALPLLCHLPPCLPAILPLLCLPHHSVHHLQFSTRGRNHTWLSPSNRGSHHDLKTPIHPSLLNRGSHLHKLFKDPTGHAGNDPC